MTLRRLSHYHSCIPRTNWISCVQNTANTMKKLEPCACTTLWTYAHQTSKFTTPQKAVRVSMCVSPKNHGDWHGRNLTKNGWRTLKFQVPSTFHCSYFFFWGGGGVEWIWTTGILSGPTFPTSRWLPHETPKKCPGQDAETLLHFASCFVNSPGWVKVPGSWTFSWQNFRKKKKTWNNWGDSIVNIYNIHNHFPQLVTTHRQNPRFRAEIIKRQKFGTHMSPKRYHFKKISLILNIKEKCSHSSASNSKKTKLQEEGCWK